MGCTTVVATLDATKDGQTYLLWNFDMLRLARPVLDRFRLFVTASEGYSYVAWGIPGWLHIGLMNEKGLCFVGNVVGMADDGAEGTTVFEIIQRAMTSCSTVEQVAKVYRESDRLVLPGYSAAMFANMNSMYADEQGSAITIEYSKNHIAVVKVDEIGVMVETNHHQYLDRGLSGSADPARQKAIAGSYIRLGRAWELARKYSGKFDLDVMMCFASDHGQNYSLLSGYDYEVPENRFMDDSTICGHLWNAKLYLQKFRLRRAAEAMLEGETLYSFILEPRRRTVWLCRGKPCHSKYAPHEFGEALEKSNGKRPVEQRLLRGKARSLALSLLGFAERAFPVR